MAIRVGADDRITDRIPDEEVYLPGPSIDAEPDGPFPFVFPRVAELLKLERRMVGADPAQMSALQVRGVMSWLAEGFGPEAWEHIVGRRDDEVDLLDDEHLLKLYQLLLPQGTGRPTTSSDGASRQPWKKRQPAAPSAPVSASTT